MLHKVENLGKNFFLNEGLSREWTTHGTGDLIIGMRYFIGLVGRNIDVFLGVHEDLALAKEI